MGCPLAHSNDIIQAWLSSKDRAAILADVSSERHKKSNATYSDADASRSADAGNGSAALMNGDIPRFIGNTNTRSSQELRLFSGLVFPWMTRQKFAIPVITRGASIQSISGSGLTGTIHGTARIKDANFNREKLIARTVTNLRPKIQALRNTPVKLALDVKDDARHAIESKRSDIGSADARHN